MSGSALSASGQFSISNGQIIGPDGQPFIARGIGVMEGDEPTAAQLLADFPGVNFVRLAIFDYTSPSALASYVNSLTAAGIVVELEDHNNGAGNAGGSQGTIFTGSQLSNELSWYSSVASAFKNNPLVWFGTNNEPSEVDANGNTNPAALSTWQRQTYQAVRSTGNSNPILLEMNSWGPGQTGVGYTPSVYAGMSNVVWDVHYYGWVSGYSTNESTVASTLSSMVSEAQKITAANGTIPVIIGEYGNSTTGLTIDQNGSQVVQAVEQSGLGSAAWAWGTGNPGDGLTTAGGGLSAYGKQVAAWIAQGGAVKPPVPVNVTPSADDTVVSAGSGSTITDATGNLWTIASGVVQENGAPAAYSANVTQIAYVGGAVWQENAAGDWWGWDGSGWNLGKGTTTSPLPATPTPPPTPTPTPAPTPTPVVTPSADDTAVKASSAGTITDAAGNKWTIASGVVQENGAAAGYSANVAEIAYVGGNVWQENASNLWWEWTGKDWGTGGGISTSPVPPTPTPTPTPAPTPAPTPSPNDTAVTDTGHSIMDAAGNTWNISAQGQVSVNGVADPTTANVTELAYVDGNVWQENASNLWWSKATPADQWGPAQGTSVSPLPPTIIQPTISVTAGGSTSAISGSTPGMTVSAEATLDVVMPGAAVVAVGASDVGMSFLHMSVVDVFGGAGSANLKADSGINTWVVGSGSMNVTGGAGSDAYLVHVGSGALTISDFSAAKGDLIQADAALKASYSVFTDGTGGTKISFGGIAGDIDLKGITVPPKVSFS